MRSTDKLDSTQLHALTYARRLTVVTHDISRLSRTVQFVKLRFYFCCYFFSLRSLISSTSFMVYFCVMVSYYILSYHITLYQIKLDPIFTWLTCLIDLRNSADVLSLYLVFPEDLSALLFLLLSLLAALSKPTIQKEM